MQLQENCVYNLPPKHLSKEEGVASAEGVYLSNNKLSLLESHPELALEWHPFKNKLSPSDITKGSHKAVWWRCKHGHEWSAIISNRSYKKRGCPYCSGFIVLPEASLKATHPMLLKEWDYERNTIDPISIRHGSNKKVWWICPKGHHWQATIHNRTGGKGCPHRHCKYTAKQGKSLAHTHPQLIKEWDNRRNTLSPSSVTSGVRDLVWWICQKGHSWRARIYARTHGNGRCPYCCGQKCLKENSIVTTHKHLLAEWDTVNNEKSPTTISAGSELKVWWKCSKGHRWKTSVCHRTNQKSGCPYCGNILVDDSNCLLKTHPDLFLEWDTIKNKFSMQEVTAVGCRQSICACSYF